jgi:hypothetical protein
MRVFAKEHTKVDEEMVLPTPSQAQRLAALRLKLYTSPIYIAIRQG